MSSEVRTYAKIFDILDTGKSLSEEQSGIAIKLLETASAKLRLLAKKYGKDIDEMIADEVYGADYAVAVKSTIVQAVIRALDSIANSTPAITQGSQTALGYSVSMTYLNAGQSLYFLRNELKDLGILRQTYGALEVYGCADD